MKQKGAKIIIDCLLEQGVEYVFGYPGGTILDIFDELYKASDKLPLILTSHEQGAAHAADGYARASGKVGVVLATSGPGATNLVTGIANAYMDSVPMVAITGNVPLALLGRDSFQEVDITGITMPITKHNYIVKDVKDLAGTMREAFYIASSGRPGPVLVDIPKNIQQEECEFKTQKPKEFVSVLDTKQDGIVKALEILKVAKKPIMYIGGGAINASAELQEFIQKFDIPAANSIMGSGVIPYDNPLSLGLIGMHGHAGANKSLINSDTIIAVGTRFSDRVATNRLKFGENKNIIHIDIDFAEIDKNVMSNCYIKGDAKQIIKYLTANAKEIKHTDWVKECKDFVLNSPFKTVSSPLCPREILKELRAQTPDNQIVATDVGQHQMWTAQSFGCKQPRSLITSGGLGTMGYGLGAANGAAFARKENAVLITGDGSYHMNLNETVTASKYNLPVKIFLFNNSALGMVRQWQTLFYEKRYSSTNLTLPTNYEKLAEAFGVRYFELTKDSDIKATVKAALAHKGTVLVNCKINPEGVVLPMVPAGQPTSNMIE